MGPPTPAVAPPQRPYHGRKCHGTLAREGGEGGEALETVQIKWLEKLEMTDLDLNTVMTHWPSPF